MESVSASKFGKFGEFMIFEKNATINEIISTYPETMKFFSDLNMSCSSCFAVKFDTLENGALMHGMDVNVLIKQLNQYIQTLPSSSVPTEK